MRTILIVEDDDDLRLIMSWGLKAEGFEVACAADGQQALESVFRLRPDLVVLDWELPILSGIEVCTLLRSAEHSVGIPVVMVTGRYEPDDIRRGIDTGADAYVTKPFAVETLAQEIRRILDRSAEQMVLTQPHCAVVAGPTSEAAGPETQMPARDADDRPADDPKTVPVETCAHRARRPLPCRGRHGR